MKKTLTPMTKTPNTRHQASFRDPSGYMFHDGDTLRRVINPIYFPVYKKLRDSGFYQTLMDKGLLIPHEETAVSEDQIVITPEPISFISHPYEWSFEQFKHAALLTLQIQKFALSKGFILKDASAYNVTFHKGKPIFIDTLSFDIYVENTPWRAYQQFVTHFFGPLALANYHGSEMLKMLELYIDGIPVKLISSLLPGKSRFKPSIYAHIHLLAKMEQKHSEDYEAKTQVAKLSKKAQDNLLTNLFDTIKKWKLSEVSEWGNYYEKINYDDQAFEVKKQMVRQWVLDVGAKTLIDVGGNDGTFARTVLSEMDEALVTDIDHNAVAYNYHQVREAGENNMIPLVSDVLQPVPGIGFNNTERASLLERLDEYAPDVTLALALIHHITLSGNVPFEKSAAFFAKFSKHLIIEFPKREDSWVNSLLVRKREFMEHFDFYNEAEFEKGYGVHFQMKKKQPLEGTHRVLYHFVRPE